MNVKTKQLIFDITIFAVIGVLMLATMALDGGVL